MPPRKKVSTADPRPDPKVDKKSEGEGEGDRESATAATGDSRPDPSDAPIEDQEPIEPQTHEDLPVFGYRLKAKLPAGGLSTRRRPVQGGRVKIEILANVERRETYEPETGGWYLVLEASHVSHRIIPLPSRGAVNGELFDMAADAKIVDADGILKEHVATCEHCFTGSSLNSMAGKCAQYMELLSTYRVDHPAEFGDDVIEEDEGGEASTDDSVVDLTNTEETAHETADA